MSGVYGRFKRKYRGRYVSGMYFLGLVAQRFKPTVYLGKVFCCPKCHESGFLYLSNLSEFKIKHYVPVREQRYCYFGSLGAVLFRARLVFRGVCS